MGPHQQVLDVAVAHGLAVLGSYAGRLANQTRQEVARVLRADAFPDSESSAFCSAVPGVPPTRRGSLERPTTRSGLRRARSAPARAVRNVGLSP